MNDLPHNSADDHGTDADPMIDALLLEIVAEDPARRSQPPDLRESILAKLAEIETETPALVLPSTDLAGRSSLVRALSIVVAVAAAIIGVMWLAGANERPEDDSSSQVAQQEGPAVDSPSPSTGDGSGTPMDIGVATTGPADATEQDKTKTRAPGIRLDKPMLANTGASGAGSADLANGTDADTRARDLEPISAVASRVADHAERYWDRLGVTPSKEASFGETADRMQKRLNLAVRSDWLEDADALRDQLARRSTARGLATRWLANTTGADLDLVRQKENADLVNEVGDAFAGNRPFSNTFVSLVDGSGDHSAKWYGLLSRGNARDHRVSAVAGQLAQLTMNADLRCVRCHDSMIGRSGTQDDHWSFVALVRQKMQRQGDRWKVGKPESFVPTFFELADGRQRLAQPLVSETLLPVDDKPQDFEAWTRALPQSDAFARSVVDSLWSMVHGRSLSPAPMEAFAPPSDEALDQMRDELAGDLRASDFDVARTLSLIVTSPMNRRSIPEPLRAENSLVASDAARAEALEKVVAFAAAVETPVAKRSQRIELAMNRVGGNLADGKKGTVLAQPMLKPLSDSTPKSTVTDPKQSFVQQLSVDFPGEDAGLPVSWLRSIEDYDQQVQHLVYLSGGHSVPENITETANRLRDAGTVESALSRLWWILKD